MASDAMAPCCLCWCKDILQQSDRLTIDQIPQYGFIKSLLAQQLMEMWIRIWTFVFTSYLLGELWDLASLSSRW